MLDVTNLSGPVLLTLVALTPLATIVAYRSAKLFFGSLSSTSDEK